MSYLSLFIRYLLSHEPFYVVVGGFFFRKKRQSDSIGPFSSLPFGSSPAASVRGTHTHTYTHTLGGASDPTVFSLRHFRVHEHGLDGGVSLSFSSGVFRLTRMATALDYTAAQGHKPNLA